MIDDIAEQLDDSATPAAIALAAAEATELLDALSRKVNAAVRGVQIVANNAEIAYNFGRDATKKYRELVTEPSEHGMHMLHVRHRDGLIALLRMWGCVGKPFATKAALAAEYKRAHERVRKAWTIDEFAECWAMIIAEDARDADAKKLAKRKGRK
jgi:hypothetical protein